MKRLIALAAIALSCSISYAQNVEHQIVASQFGAYRVDSVGQGYSFPPSSCQISAGGKNFPAFTRNVPIKIVDPPNTEIVTPSQVNITQNNCSVVVSPVHNHQTFYLTSGTGGLQEAINYGPVLGTNNTVILDQFWYAQVLPSVSSSVISTVKGSTLLGLIDVTQSPYTTYSWNGAQYIQNASGGGGGATTPATNGLLKGTGVINGVTTAVPGTDYVLPSGSITGTAGNLSGTPTLPYGTSAVTQSLGDNTAKLATDAFVIANSSNITIPGLNTQVLFNSSGALGANSNFTFNSTSQLLSVPNVVVSNISTTPNTSVVCPNGTGGALTTVGCVFPGGSLYSFSPILLLPGKVVLLNKSIILD